MAARRAWDAKSESEKTARIRDMMTALVEKAGAGTSIERAVEAVLKDMGVHYEAQKIFDRAIADFYIPASNAIIECDGIYWHSLPHVAAKDKRRDGWLRSLGFIVVRIGENAIKTDARAAVLKALRAIDHAQRNVPDRERQRGA